MSDSSFVQLIKHIAMDAVSTSKPCDYRVGIVTGINPLKVKISQKIELEEEFLCLSRNVTDFETEVTIEEDYEWKTEDKEGGHNYDAFALHSHDIMVSKKKVKIHNSLKIGEEVLIIRKSGGQKYLILDRLVS